MSKKSEPMRVPVGIEKLLFRAAKDPEIRARLLGDRGRVLAELGGGLRASERAMLAAIPDSALAAMIGSINPENPWRRSFMGQVAGVASLAVATATVSCSPNATRGDDHHTDVDGLPPDGSTTTGSDTSTDSSTDSDAGTESETGSVSNTPTPTGSGTPTNTSSS